MGDYTINRIVVSEEAKFDYAFIFNMLVGEFGSDLPSQFRLDAKIQQENTGEILFQSNLQ